MIASLFLERRSVDVPCTVEIEHTSESLHAHVHLEGIDVAAGDKVVVHDAPVNVPFGERGTYRCRATVTRGTVFDALWAHVAGYLDITELYEVGFEGKSA